MTHKNVMTGHVIQVLFILNNKKSIFNSISLLQCIVENGVWEPWGDWSSCYDSCAAGRTQERNRTCHGPFYEGQNCSEGGEREEISCPSCPGNYLQFNIPAKLGLIKL